MIPWFQTPSFLRPLAHPESEAQAPPSSALYFNQTLVSRAHSSASVSESGLGEVTEQIYQLHRC